jgi:hypothetical protein
MEAEALSTGCSPRLARLESACRSPLTRRSRGHTTRCRTACPSDAAQPPNRQNTLWPFMATPQPRDRQPHSIVRLSEKRVNIPLWRHSSCQPRAYSVPPVDRRSAVDGRTSGRSARRCRPHARTSERTSCHALEEEAGGAAYVGDVRDSGAFPRLASDPLCPLEVHCRRGALARVRCRWCLPSSALRWLPLCLRGPRTEVPCPALVTVVRRWRTSMRPHPRTHYFARYRAFRSGWPH